MSSRRTKQNPPEDTAAPQWLDDEESEAWMALMGVLMRLPNALDRQLQRDTGLTHFEYGVLTALSQAPDRTMRLSVLAGLTDAQLPRLSQVVTRLEGRGLVTRRPDPQDGRSTLATLTKRGMDAVRASAPGHVAEVRRVVFDHLTRAQVRQLREIARRIGQGLGQEPC